jgi:hypothetical protein
MILPPLYKYLAILALAASLIGLGWLQGAHHEQLKAVKFEATTVALGNEALKHAKEVSARQAKNLVEVKRGLNQKLKAAGDNAVRNYVARYGMQCDTPGESRVPTTPGSQQGDDGATTTIMAIDATKLREDFIRACARTTAILSSWQEWANLNHVPVEQ